MSPEVPADFRPATAALTAIIQEIKDDQLELDTPSSGTVGELLDHVESLCLAFTAAATKTRLPGGSSAPTPDASRLGADWRQRLPERLAALAEAWRPPSAWAGTAEAGGNDMPAEIAGLSGLDEVIVHGWDLAVATGQPYPDTDPALDASIAAAYGWVETVVAQQPGGIPGLFGPRVSVPEDASLLHRLLGLTGRSPGWHPGS
jgi:uncharacterized protein (TIGR03086 family)